jgi:hypothetical protein
LAPALHPDSELCAIAIKASEDDDKWDWRGRRCGCGHLVVDGNIFAFGFEAVDMWN